MLSSLAADAGYVVLTPLGAVLFAGLGRHPLAGLCAAFAGVSAGFSANLLLTSLDPLLAAFTLDAARIFDAGYTLTASANYYFMLASTPLLTLAGWWVTERIVVPRLGEWEGQAEHASDIAEPLSALQRRGLLWAAVAAAVATLLIALLVVPEWGLLRGEDGGLGPFYSALAFLMALFFFAPGLAYAVATREVRNDRDVARITGDTIGTMGAYIVLAFAAAQFVAYFKWSNIGLLLSLSGASLLDAIGFVGLPLLLGFVVVAGVINLFVGSASAKWALMAPVLVPMGMALGLSPEVVQAAYRVGDSVTNIITPLNPYFPIVIAFGQQYVPGLRLGTLIAAMLPYAVVFAIVWSLLFALWFLLGLPLGPGASLDYALPTG